MPAAMPTKAEPDEWISEPEVMARFGLAEPWLRRHRSMLRARHILSTPTRKAPPVFHVARLRRLLEERTALNR